MLAAVLACWAKVLTGQQDWWAEAPRKKSLAKVALAAGMAPTLQAAVFMVAAAAATLAWAVLAVCASFGVRGVRSHQQIQVTCKE